MYTSEHLSLAVLESLIHADPDLLPDDLTAFQIEIPSEIAEPALAAFEKNPLPDDWEDPDVSVRLGQEWVASGGPALVVPSIVVPQERNVLLNPRHARAPEIHVVGWEPFAFDTRLFGE